MKTWTRFWRWFFVDEQHEFTVWHVPASIVVVFLAVMVIFLVWHYVLGLP